MPAARQELHLAQIKINFFGLVLVILQLDDGRLRNPKNQLLQIDSSTIVECSL